MSGPELIKRNCSVPGCFRNSMYFSLPSDEEKSRKWLKVIGRTDLEVDDVTARICENHFDPSCIVSTMSGLALMRNAWPKYNLPKSYISRLLDFFTLPKRTPIVKADKGVQTWPCRLNLGHSFDSVLKKIKPASVPEDWCPNCQNLMTNGEKIKVDDQTEYEIFCYLSDKFLSKNLARAVISQAVISK